MHYLFAQMPDLGHSTILDGDCSFRRPVMSRLHQQ